MEAATQLMKAEVGSLLLIDEEKQQLYFEVALGDKEERGCMHERIYGKLKGLDLSHPGVDARDTEPCFRDVPDYTKTRCTQVVHR